MRKRPIVCDGAGMRSSADRSLPATNLPLQHLAQQWLQFLASEDAFLHLDLDGIHLLHCQGQGNWTQAEKNPQLLDELVEQGWVKPFAGTLEQAEKKWPGRTAVGKLNIVTAEGRDPRLVLDSSVCNANAKSKVPEKLVMPSGLDVARTFQHEDPRGAFVGVSLDFKAAHKGMKLQEQDQGCMLFRVADKLYHYVVCHFGARFSAYWWQRLGAMLLRITHALLSKHAHRAWIYVDDLLALLARTAFVEQLAHMLCFLTAINAPISWKKAQLSHEITWCGWTFNFDFETVTLAAGKLDKLQQQLHELARSKKIPRKLLERALGLLMWATTTCPQLPLYRDLHSGKGTLHSVHANSWQTFLDALDDNSLCTNQSACGFRSEPKSSRLAASQSQARARCPEYRHRTNRSGFACRTRSATNCTCATRAAQLLPGLRNALPLQGFAH